jgi:hypothetical protein
MIFFQPVVRYLVTYGLQKIVHHPTVDPYGPRRTSPLKDLGAELEGKDNRGL